MNDKQKRLYDVLDRIHTLIEGPYDSVVISEELYDDIQDALKTCKP